MTRRPKRKTLTEKRQERREDGLTGKPISKYAKKRLKRLSGKSEEQK